MRPLIEQLLRAGRDPAPALHLPAPRDLDPVFGDGPCVKADIHFPVDWVLLRDATRTLLHAVHLIRAQGLKPRRAQPASFITRRNRWCIHRTHTARQPEGKKQRKPVLRPRKQLTRVGRAQAQRYRDLLDPQGEQTDGTRPQTEQVLRRRDQGLRPLPAAVKQAPERIMGERQVHNEDKILSLAEPDVQVVVRHKAGARVQWGNDLLLAASVPGWMGDWELFGQRVPAAASLVKPCVQRIEAGLGQKLPGWGTDRGLDSAANRQGLGRKKIFNGRGPRAPANLEARMSAPDFAAAQQRRSQTEGRLGLFKNNVLGRPWRAKGFAHRALAVSGGVLAHNLWVMARLPEGEGASQAARPAA